MGAVEEEAVVASAASGSEALIAERLGSAPCHAAGNRSLRLPAVCAVAALAALRVAVDQWLDLGTDPAQTSSMAALRLQVDAVLAELAADLDRPGLATRGRVRLQSCWAAGRPPRP